MDGMRSRPPTYELRMKRNKNLLKILLPGVVAIGLTLWWQLGNKRAPTTNTSGGAIARFFGANKTGNKGGKKTVTPQTKGESTTNGSSEILGTLPDADDEDAIYDAVVKELDAALDDDNIEVILKEAAKLRQHHLPEVRSRVAFALSWTGLKGFGELTAMLADPDPEVASEALDHWKVSLAEISSEHDKALLLGATAETLAGDISDDLLFDMIMELSMLDDEYALPPLVTLLQSVSTPDQKEEVTDAIHMAMEMDDPAEDEATLIVQAMEEANRLTRERLAEEAEEAAEAAAPSPPQNH